MRLCKVSLSGVQGRREKKELLGVFFDSDQEEEEEKKRLLNPSLLSAKTPQICSQPSLNVGHERRLCKRSDSRAGEGVRSSSFSSTSSLFLPVELRCTLIRTTVLYIQLSHCVSVRRPSFDLIFISPTYISSFCFLRPRTVPPEVLHIELRRPARPAEFCVRESKRRVKLLPARTRELVRERFFPDSAALCFSPQRFRLVCPALA